MSKKSSVADELRTTRRMIGLVCIGIGAIPIAFTVWTIATSGWISIGMIACSAVVGGGLVLLGLSRLVSTDDEASE